MEIFHFYSFRRAKMLKSFGVSYAYLPRLKRLLHQKYSVNLARYFNLKSFIVGFQLKGSVGNPLQSSFHPSPLFSAASNFSATLISRRARPDRPAEDTQTRGHTHAGDAMPHPDMAADGRLFPHAEESAPSTSNGER